jgi:hypothetical protein
MELQNERLKADPPHPAERSAPDAPQERRCVPKHDEGEYGDGGYDRVVGVVGELGRLGELEVEEPEEGQDREEGGELDKVWELRVGWGDDGKG